jgi:hypothetical protein
MTSPEVGHDRTLPHSRERKEAAETDRSRVHTEEVAAAPLVPVVPPACPRPTDGGYRRPLVTDQGLTLDWTSPMAAIEEWTARNVSLPCSRRAAWNSHKGVLPGGQRGEESRASSTLCSLPFAPASGNWAFDMVAGPTESLYSMINLGNQSEAGPYAPDARRGPFGRRRWRRARSFPQPARSQPVASESRDETHGCRYVNCRFGRGEPTTTQ